MGLLNELLLHCLFESTHHTNKGPKLPKCKSNRSRSAAFKLLQCLSKDCDENLQKLLDFFYPLHIEADWRTKKDWSITPKIMEKSITGYVGLKNLGCSNLNKLHIMFVILLYIQLVL